MSKNIFEHLNLKYKEDIITDFIKISLEENIEFRQKFINRINEELKDENKIKIETANINNYTFKSFTRRELGNKDCKCKPDLVLTIKKELEEEVIIIENKILSNEGDAQTKRYEGELNFKNLKVESENIKPKYFYLTLIPNDKPLSDKFIHITYNDIKECFNVNDDKYLKDYYEWLGEFYNKLNILSLKNKIIKEINFPDDKKDNIKKIKLQKIIMEALKEIEKNIKCGINKINASRQYLVVFSKEGWSNNDEDINKNKNIHIEIEISIKKINILVHYETEPYMSEAKIIEKFNIKKENIYEDYYNKLKLTFKENFNKNLNNILEEKKTELCEKLWKNIDTKDFNKNTKNKIYKYEIPLKNVTVEELQGEIKEVLNILVSSIDKVIKE